MRIARLESDRIDRARDTEHLLLARSARSRAPRRAAQRKQLLDGIAAPDIDWSRAERLCQAEAIVDRVAMDLRIAYYELLLNRAKIGVREQSVRVMQDELKTQQERFAAGTVGELNVRRAEVSLANEQPELFDAQARLVEALLVPGGARPGRPDLVIEVERPARAVRGIIWRNLLAPMTVLASPFVGASNDALALVGAQVTTAPFTPWRIVEALEAVGR